MFEVGDIVEYDHSQSKANLDFYIKLQVIDINHLDNFRGLVLEYSDIDYPRYQVGKEAGGWASHCFIKVQDPTETLLDILDKLEESWKKEI